MTELIYLGIGIVGLILLVVIMVSCYIKAPSNQAYILAGVRKQPRVLIGTGGFKIPFLERLDKVYLGQITVDINTETPVPTSDFINVDVDAVAKVAVMKTEEGTRLAAKNFLNMGAVEISQQLKDSLQGNMREIIGTMDLKSLNNNRDGFSDEVMKKAAPDMEKLGIEILSCNIQNITDRDGLIENMGADNTWKIKKDAANAKAVAQREIAVVEAENAKQANDARVKSETEIAERNNELEIKKASLKRESDTQKAIADSAYKIQEQEQQKTVNVKTVEAEIVRTKKEQELTNENILVQQNILEANVNKKSDADKYQTMIKAEAELEQRKRAAEACTFGAQQEAEAKAMDKKAEAYTKYNKAAIVQMVIEKLPEVAKAVSEPMSSIDNLNVYSSDGSGCSSISGQVPVVVKQVFDTIKSATGVDLSDVMKADTIQAKVDKNVNLGINADVEVEK